MPFLLALMALLLAVGNIVFWRCPCDVNDPRQLLWPHILKVVVTLALTAAVFRYLLTVAPWRQRPDCRASRQLLTHLRGWLPLTAIANASTTLAGNTPRLGP
jgi:hypothetical protein